MGTHSPFKIDGIDAKTRFRHYVNIERMEQRLQRLLGDFSWGRMDRIFLNRTAPLAQDQPGATRLAQEW